MNSVQQMSGGILNGFHSPLIAAIIALAVSWIVTPYVRKFAIAKGAVDDPSVDDRRVHKQPTPRWGGVAIYAGMVVAILTILPFAYPHGRSIPLYLIGIIVVGGVLVLVGALDDLYAYKAKIQAAVLLAAGLAIQLFGDKSGRIQIQTLAIPLSADHHYIPLGPIFVRS